MDEQIEVLKNHWKFRLSLSPDPIARAHVSLIEWDPKKSKGHSERAHYSFVRDTAKEVVQQAYDFHISKIGV